jgi:hypothetical protein
VSDNIRFGQDNIPVSEYIPKIKRPLGRPRCRWEDNIKLDLREIGIDGRTGFGWLRIGSNGGLW